MSDLPIIFSGPMVRALIAGRKTQTRRLMKLPPAPSRLGEWQVSTIGGDGLVDHRGRAVPQRPCLWHTRNGATVVPRYQIGDRLYVREAFTIAGVFSDVVEVRYQASERDGYTRSTEQVPIVQAGGAKVTWPRYRPSIHMPRWASRLTLAVTDVRIQRLQEIDLADIRAEGVHQKKGSPLWWATDDAGGFDPDAVFGALWNSLHVEGDRWEDNPFVVATTFTVEQGNLDREAQAA